MKPAMLLSNLETLKYSWKGIRMIDRNSIVFEEGARIITEQMLLDIFKQAEQHAYHKTEAVYAYRLFPGPWDGTHLSNMVPIILALTPKSIMVSVYYDMANLCWAMQFILFEKDFAKFQNLFLMEDAIHAFVYRSTVARSLTVDEFRWLIDLKSGMICHE